MKQSKIRIKWTQKVPNFLSQEDQILFELVQENGKTDWIFISEELYKITKVERTSQQCMERYKSQINPKVNKDKWEKDELIRLFQLFEIFGTKWTKIQKKLKTNRSSRDIKNRIHLAIRKGLRRICKSFGIKNSTETLKKIKPKQLVEKLNTVQSEWSQQQNNGQSLWRFILRRSENMGDQQLQLDNNLSEAKFKNFVNKIAQSIGLQMAKESKKTKKHYGDEQNKQIINKITLAQINSYEKLCQQKVKESMISYGMSIEEIDLQKISLNSSHYQRQLQIFKPQQDSVMHYSPFNISNIVQSQEDEPRMPKNNHNITNQLKQRKPKRRLFNRNKKK